MRRPAVGLLSPVLVPALALALVAPAAAQAPLPSPAQPAPTPAPRPPAAGSLRLVVERGFRLGRTTVAFRRQRLRVHGLVSRYVPGQVVVVRIAHGRGRAATVHRTVRRVPGHRTGRFLVYLRAGSTGRLRVRALHRATSRQRRFSARAAVSVILPHAGLGAGGLRVRFLQQRLLALGYYGNRTGRYDDATRRAVLAFRKVNGKARVHSAGPQIFYALARYKGAFRVRYPGHGRHVEADLTHQVLALVYPRGRVYKVFPLSSGKPSTPTVLGSFHFYSKTRGANAEGMINSNYFHGGYAVHGYHDVPAYAASHGCLRIPIPNSLFVFRWIRLGQRIDVYYR